MQTRESAVLSIDFKLYVVMSPKRPSKTRMFCKTTNCALLTAGYGLRLLFRTLLDLVTHHDYIDMPISQGASFEIDFIKICRSANFENIYSFQQISQHHIRIDIRYTACARKHVYCMNISILVNE